MKWLDHYLNDFIVLGHSSSKECQEGLQAALETFEELGFLVAEEKNRRDSNIDPIPGNRS